MALPSNLLVNIRPQTTAQVGQKPGMGQQRVLINQQLVRPQNNTVSALKIAEDRATTKMNPLLRR